MTTTGLIFIACGIAAIAFPFATGISLSVLFGLLLAVSGALQAWIAWSARGFDGGHPWLGLVVFGLGLVLLLAPFVGVAAVTLLIGLGFLVQGVVQLSIASGMNGDAGRVWMMASGIVAFAVGLLVLLQWPSSGRWVVGVLVGINLVGIGLALLFARGIAIGTGVAGR